jgi:hypothetical protein
MKERLMSDTQTTKYGWSQDMPTSLLDKLKADLKQSMLNKDVEARSAIRQIMAEFPKLTVPITLDDKIRTNGAGDQK